MAIQATFGTTISIDSVVNAEAISITPPQVKIGTIQTTNLANTTKAHTFIAGMEDAGEASFEANFEKASFDAFAALAYARAEVPVVITIPAPNTATYTMQGIITGYSISSIGTGDDIIKCSFTVKISGNGYYAD
jgi:outer membrane translocation and assembly module TamA